jgi:predicted regulator of Ras-like GTPase activity (Roadblock/LC7/MglB family)
MEGMEGQALLGKLKERDIMAAIVGFGGSRIASNFGMQDGVENYSSSTFNVGDALLRQAGEAAEEVVVTTDMGNLVLKRIQEGILIVLIKTKDQYAFYRGLMGVEEPAAKEEKEGK